MRIAGVGLNPTRIGLLGILNRMGAAIESLEEERSAGRRAARRPSSPRAAPLEATRVHAEEVAVAIDELPLVALARLLRRGRDGRGGAGGAARARSPTGSRASSTGCGALGAEIEATRGRLRGDAGTAACAAARSTRRGDHRLAMLGAVAGLASREGVEVAGFEAAAVSYPGFEADLARSLAKAAG